ncbi:MAG TPA: hypothetical protein VFU50_01285 [Terriglobales bacterium]|nr:hypothetical protein [Terriglobales bacterium]
MNSNDRLAGQIKTVIFQHSETNRNPISNAAIGKRLGYDVQVVAKATAELFDRAYIERIADGWRWKYETPDSPTVEVAI